jgi:hypothetical protein
LLHGCHARSFNIVKYYVEKILKTPPVCDPTLRRRTTQGGCPSLKWRGAWFHVHEWDAEMRPRRKKHRPR